MRVSLGFALLSLLTAANAGCQLAETSFWDMKFFNETKCNTKTGFQEFSNTPAVLDGCFNLTAVANGTLVTKSFVWTADWPWIVSFWGSAGCTGQEIGLSIDEPWINPHFSQNSNSSPIKSFLVVFGAA